MITRLHVKTTLRRQPLEDKLPFSNCKLHEELGRIFMILLRDIIHRIVGGMFFDWLFSLTNIFGQGNRRPIYDFIRFVYPPGKYPKSRRGTGSLVKSIVVRHKLGKGPEQFPPEHLSTWLGIRHRQGDITPEHSSSRSAMFMKSNSAVIFFFQKPSFQGRTSNLATWF